MSEIPLFVFGTLRQGHENHHYLAGHFVRMIPARLMGFDRTGPIMIDRSPKSAVDGELYFLKPDEYAATMAGCDELEELFPGQLIGPDYQRLLVQVETAEGPYAAWAYVSAATAP